MEDQVTVYEPVNVTTKHENNYSMLQFAIEKGASIDQLEKLMALQERKDANEARKAYVVAMAAFKADPPRIGKDQTVDFTNKAGVRTNYKHASLANVTEKINSSLSRHGLSAAWKLNQEGGLIKVTCCITHVMGHMECTSLSAPLDATGNKNPIQQAQSTASYLERYTILALTGLATHDQDDDGRGYDNPIETVNEHQQGQIIDMMADKNVNESQFLAWLSQNIKSNVESVDCIPVDKFNFVIKTLETVKVNP